ncbi:hypothetical protein TKK_0011896 [Trichogramma kaykai]
MAGYYRRFIQDFSKIAKPLHDLTKKGNKFDWSRECETSFQTLKDCLISAPILIFPDFTKPFILTTDASDLAIGAVLSQEKESFEHPIGYLSRVLNEAEINYSTTEKECLAALYAMYHYRPYLLGRQFTLVADHEPLNWMHSRKDPGQRLMRWMFKFTGYQYTFKYKPGKKNVVTDCLSRNPVTTLPEWEINRNLPQLRILMIKRKNKSTRASSSDTSTPNNPRKGVTSSSAADTSALGQEFTDTERSTDDETQSQVQEDNCPTVPDTATAPENKTNIIITAPPITDSDTSEGEDTLDETEEVFTQLSDAELLKAANEINISQNLINKKAFELEDINAEMELENNELNNKSCFLEGDCADEATRDYLDSIDTFDERNFTDKTLTDKVNRLVAKSLAATKDSDILIRGGEHNNLNQNNFNTTSHIKPMVETPRFQSTPLSQRFIPPNPQPSNDIPQDQNDTPVVLNFTQPSIPDFSIFVPVPMNETPMNRYKPAYITTDNPSDKECVNEQMSGHNIITSRNCLTYKSDNYVYFISQDCGPYTKNSRLLSDIGTIDY